MNFERYSSWQGKTWCYGRFQSNHTQLNNFYWTTLSTIYHAQKISKQHEDAVIANQVFPVRDSAKLNWPLNRWRMYTKESENWLRLNVLMSMSSYLELYIRCATRAALESDPCLLYGKPRLVDGVELLIHNESYGFAKEAEPCASGDWNSRFSQYTSLFKPTDDQVKKFQSVIGDLEYIRKVRNSVGHSFGFDMDGLADDGLAATVKHYRISHDRIQKLLGIVEDTAATIEECLSSHVGDYETVRMFHRRGQQTDLVARGRELKADIFKSVGRSPGNEYFSGLAKYYRKLSP